MEKAIVKSDGLSVMIHKPDIKKRFDEVLGNKSNAFIASLISAVSTNPMLKNAEPNSVISSAMIAASLDLPINQNLGFAYVVPYSGYAQFQMGWKGYVQLAMRTGLYKTINAVEVYEGELIKHNKFTGEMEFDSAKKKSTKIIGYVAYFKLLNGFEKYFYMTQEEMVKHGVKYSKSYDSDKGQWKNNPIEMGKKTVIKLLLSKYGILSTEMQKALRYDQAVVKDIDGEPEYIDNAINKEATIETETVDMPKTIEAEVVKQPDPMPQEAQEALKADDGMEKVIGVIKAYSPMNETKPAGICLQENDKVWYSSEAIEHIDIMSTSKGRQVGIQYKEYRFGKGVKREIVTIELL